MCRWLTYIVMLLVASTAFGRAASASDGKRFTVVIDPGHGGKDIGCRGKLTNEKTVVLEVARKLGEIIAKEHPEVEIVYTRSDDRFIELNRRAAIANKAGGDLFISIHVNSVDMKNRNRANIHGAQVYTLGLHRTDDNLEVAMRENSVIELESDFSEKYQGFDPNSSESYIIFELTQNRHHHNSVEFADGVQRELIGTAGRADKGVRQAGFLVLRASSMAAVLVELDFICNPAAERFLASDKGREKCARSIANAFTTYYRRHGAPASAESTKPKKESAAGEEYYTVQVLTSASPVADDDRRLSGVPDVEVYLHDGAYKYTCGRYKSLSAAKKALRKLKKTHSEAFIIKMRDGKRLSR